MYQILKGSSAKIQSCYQLSLRNLNQNSNINLADRVCILCKQLNIHSRIQFRTESTVANANPFPLKKRKVRKNRKYSDILVVTDNSLSQQKIQVQKLSSKDLKLLTSTDLNLNELYKLKDISIKKHEIQEEYTYNNLTIIESTSSSQAHNCTNISSFELPSTSKSNVLDVEDSKISSGEIDLDNVSDLTLTIPRISIDCDISEELEEASIGIDSFEQNFHYGSIKRSGLLEPAEEVKDEPTTNNGKKYKINVDPKRREEIASKTLAALIEVCNHLKNPQRGLNAFLFHRSRAKQKNDKMFVLIKNVRVYNTLLRGFANSGNMNKIREIVRMMDEDEVQLNVQSYASIFECIGRNTQNTLEENKHYYQRIKKQGITFDQIMNEAVFLDGEREFALMAMKIVNSTYTPTYNKPFVHYDNHLLNHLNHKERLRPHNPKQVAKSSMFTPKALKKRINKQLELEEDGYVTIASIEAKEAPTEEVLRLRKGLNEHYESWAEEATKAFIRDLATLTAKRCAFNMEPYMRCIPVKDFIKIIMDEAKKIAQGSETYSPTVTQLYRELGSKVYARYKVIKKQRTGVLDKVKSIHSKYCELYAANHSHLDVLPKEEVLINTRQYWQWTEHSVCDTGPTLEMDHQEWVPTMLQSIGKFLYHIVMHDLKVDVNCMRSSKHKNYLPAFYTIFRTQGRCVKEEVKPHPVLSRLYRASMPETLTFPTYELPMICPPLPWVSINLGGYLVSPCDVVRLPIQANLQKKRLAKSKPQHLYPSLDALNQLAAVPWKVNKQILDVILEVFKKGGSSKLDVPETPSSLSPPPSATPEMDKAERYQIFRQKLQYKRKKAEMYSLWCDCLYRLSLANHFQDDIFWLPHNMDFRGRVYPVPPHLNHLGSDLARSMLVFAEARPLGPKGLDWLKIHLINLTGLKKRDPVSERLKFANEIMPDILDSADNPLTGRKWWTDSDEPWQTLACCMEIANVVRSPDHEKYLSHFPVHQDGSCNGLQHYAALGRDSAGAYSVNLVPSDVPQDVYSAVVSLVEKRRAVDAENGFQIAQVLDGFIKRKVIKQTIMTTVYGVTRFGARLQIAKQLKDIEDFPKEHVWSASSYLTTKTFESLKTMFTSTREIQDWFTECARLISSVGNRNVEWVTPLGLPIVQPYFKPKRSSSTSTYEIYPTDTYEKPNVMKQKNAFPPNFVHSLDSSHMMLTSLNCERAGITFVSVHDCYWTHPSTVHIMNQICREQFVALHSEPILEDLSVFLAERFSIEEGGKSKKSNGDHTTKRLNKVLRKLPTTGDFDISQVLKSVYFFS